ncbi:uncharacterized protein C5L36_0A02940 [Pichia kudriavzevii]|uniref:High-affinity methionine permease n=1 Tax=Pichia kudriavzevii TaxID=4909 RepID=A0A2U9QXE8_PICKU|nr:uncharacterized protein C5L36_0A02940 [Pichia kudriavzevii]AWU73692.1 hypothetical protein C5L36_0A02940 [Pichia kudriavzevii]
MRGTLTNLFRRTTIQSVDDVSVNSNRVSETHDSGDYTSKKEDHTTVIEVGTPEEKKNPLGYSVGPLSVIVLIIQGVVGTGIFTGPGTIVKSMGSIGSTYVLWLSCFFLPMFSVFLYVEFAGYYPKRNGGDVAYLEQAYTKPKFLFPTIYAAVSVVLSFTTSSALAVGQYLLSASGAEVTTWHYRGIAIAALTLSCVHIGLSTKWSLRLQNLLGFVKVVFMVFIVILGFVVLGGGTKVKDPHASFTNMWEGTTTQGNNIANSIINVAFSYGGYSYAFGVVAEYSSSKKGQTESEREKSMIRTFSFYVPVSMIVILILYILMITAYYAGGTPDEIKHSGNGVATILFQNAFQNKYATKFLNVMVALSAYGHLVTAVLSHSRGLRECGRQGVLPFPKFWTSTKPFGTPLGPILVTWIVNFIMIVAPPAGSAFNFIVDMGSYSGYIFTLALICGLLKVRRDRKLRNLGTKGQYLPLPCIIILLLFELMVIILAFVPPKHGLIGSDVTFFYATYPIVTIGLLMLCIAYYFVWRYTLPKLGGYVHREVEYILQNGEIGNTIVKVKLEEVEQWDNEHGTDEYGVAKTVVLKYEDVESQKT